MSNSTIPLMTTKMTVTKSGLKTFKIRYLRTLNLITATGWSNTNDAWAKYCNLLGDIESHLLYNEELKVYFNLKAFDASSVRYLYKLIQRLNKAQTQSKQVKLFWSCDQENFEMLEMGIDLKEVADFPVEISYNIK